jgi:hypothetical protein
VTITTESSSNRFLTNHGVVWTRGNINKDQQDTVVGQIEDYSDEFDEFDVASSPDSGGWHPYLSQETYWINQ